MFLLRAIEQVKYYLIIVMTYIPEIKTKISTNNSTNQRPEGGVFMGVGEMSRYMVASIKYIQ